ncbi:ATP-binding protein [Sporomusa aerivorans]|uniref:ATP-binding protein n=1 Tax=Sporomusa aerivorans TaxID=204936 RepID=UPI00352A23AB
MKNERIINLLYPIISNDFYRGGQASSKLKTVLHQLKLQQHIIRRIAICSYEAEMNVIIHAYYGYIQASIYADRTELVISDVGPGIADMDLVMHSGYSTAPDYIRILGFGSGMGLSTIDKYANKFFVHSVVGHGTKAYIVVNH